MINRTRSPKILRIDRLISWPTITTGLVAIAIVTSWLAFQSRSSADSPEKIVTDAVVRAQIGGITSDGTDGTLEATINGVAIYSNQVDNLAKMLQVFPAYGLSPSNRPGLLDHMINQELLRQEAERRQLIASDAQVTAFVRELSEGFQRDLGASTLPAALVNIIRGYEEAGHPLGSWPEDPFMRKTYGLMLTQGLLVEDETRDIPSTARGRESVVTARMERLQARLRSEARVVLSPQ